MKTLLINADSDPEPFFSPDPTIKIRLGENPDPQHLFKKSFNALVVPIADERSRWGQLQTPGFPESLDLPLHCRHRAHPPTNIAF